MARRSPINYQCDYYSLYPDSQPVADKILECPRCLNEGHKAVDGWVCQHCSDIMNEKEPRAVYHQCKDGLVRFIKYPGVHSAVMCSCDKKTTQIRGHYGPTQADSGERKIDPRGVSIVKLEDSRERIIDIFAKRGVSKKTDDLRERLLKDLGEIHCDVLGINIRLDKILLAMTSFKNN
jgi:hypothetical protein